MPRKRDRGYKVYQSPIRGRRKKMMVYLTPQVWEAVKRLAEKTGHSYSHVISEALERALQSAGLLENPWETGSKLF